MKETPITHRHVITRSNYKPNPGATIEGKSLTIQNESESVADMLRKLIQGAEINEKTGVWGEEEPDIDDLDLQEMAQADIAEREAIVAELKHRIANIETQWKLEAEAKKVAKKEEEKTEAT